MRDKYAQIAVQIGLSNRKGAPWMHETAVKLMEMDMEREKTKGKSMSDDHLRQVAGKM